MENKTWFKSSFGFYCVCYNLSCFDYNEILFLCSAQLKSGILYCKAGINLVGIHANMLEKLGPDPSGTSRRKILVDYGQILKSAGGALYPFIQVPVETRSFVHEKERI